MESSSPIDRDTRISSQQYLGCINRPSTWYLAKLIKTSEARTISCFIHRKLTFKLARIDIILPLLFRFEHHIIGICKTMAGQYVFAYIIFEIVDILRMMESDQFLFVCFSGAVDIEFAIDIETLDEGVGHRHSSWFHGVVFVVVKFADFFVEEVGHILAVLHLFYLILALYAPQRIHINQYSIWHPSIYCKANTLI